MLIINKFNLISIKKSRIYYKYNETIDRQSAYEILSEKIEGINEKEVVEIKKQ
ncbi:MAG: DUF853 family protein [Lutibacter sp.]|nr:DUF853 family protein [Lutibacter sp.]